MKKITLFAFAVAALSLASCKKDRTCTCTNTQTTTSPNSSSTTSSTDVTVMTKVSKGTARVNCLSTKWTNTYSAGNVTYTQVNDNVCSLK